VTPAMSASSAQASRPRNAGEIVVSFDGRSLTYGELDMLVPAYAATIYKGQGSERLGPAAVVEAEWLRPCSPASPRIGVPGLAMVAEDFLQDPQIRDWLGGVEPAWTLLTFESLQTLRREPSAIQTAIRIANDLSVGEIASSPVARNTLILLRQAIERGGLPLTATGNLSRAVVANMCSPSRVVRHRGKSRRGRAGIRNRCGRL